MNIIILIAGVLLITKQLAVDNWTIRSNAWVIMLHTFLIEAGSQARCPLLERVWLRRLVGLLDWSHSSVFNHASNSHPSLTQVQNSINLL